MKLFLDSAKVDEIEYALENWDIDGLTTNPRHVQATGRPFREVLEEIAPLFNGTDKPVSVEVNPHLQNYKHIADAGVELAAMCPNFVIKVGASEQGFRAIRCLSSQGIKTNATLIFSTTQAWHAARAGASFISPFVGWREQHGDDASAVIAEVRSMLDNFHYDSEIIAAAMRNSRQIGEASLEGAHCITAGFTVIQESFRNPFTDLGEQVFKDAWDSTPPSTTPDVC